MIKCTSCGDDIHELRLKALPNTTMCHHCVKHKDVSRVRGHVIISGKNTYSEIQLVSAEQAEKLHKIQERKGMVSAGVKVRS